MYVCGQFVFQNDQLMPESWGIVQKSTTKRDSSDTSLLKNTFLAYNQVYVPCSIFQL